MLLERRKDGQPERVVQVVHVGEPENVFIRFPESAELEDCTEALTGLKR